MEPQRRWINRYQPQTLVIGTMLLYLEGVFSLLRGSEVLLLLGLLMFPSGYLVANDKKVGWQMAVAVVGLAIVARIRIYGFEPNLFLVLLFPGALLALLLLADLPLALGVSTQPIEDARLGLWRRRLCARSLLTPLRLRAATLAGT